MKVIGLTGGTGSGKSTVAAMLRKNAIPVIDADDLARRVCVKGSPTLSAIVTTFDKNILASDGSLDRKKLAKIVFDDQHLLRSLEAIVHPAIENLYQQELERLKESGHQIVVYMAPLIFEKDLYKRLTKTLLITARREVIEGRLADRDLLSHEDIKKRLAQQWSNEIKAKLADEVIENNESVDNLYRNLTIVWEKLTGMKLPSMHHD